MICRRLSTFLVVAGLSLVACGDSSRSASQSTPVRARVVYAVDGDTLRVELPAGDLTYVRLIGIDSPEESDNECGADQASVSMEQLAPEGVAVLLRGDRVAGDRDRYGRLLAHVFVGGRQLELAQLRRGWVEVYRFEGQRFDGLARFNRAEQGARRAARGVWSLCGGDFHSAR